MDDAKCAGSAWNSAGTFEEKNVTGWFSDTVKAEVKGSVQIGCPGVTDRPDEVRLRFSVKKTSGDASIACARGKVRGVHDFSVTVGWKFASTEGKSADLEDGATVKGTLVLDSDGDGDWDLVTCELDSDFGPKNPGDRKLFQEFVKANGKGLQPEVIKKLKRSEQLLKEKAKPPA